MAKENSEIRTILAPISGGQVLLPGSVVAEVVDVSGLRAVKAAPEWVMGEIDWKDWRVPVVSFAMLGGTAETEAPGPKSRVLVIKSLAEAAGTPYVGLLISGVPRLSSVEASGLTEPDPASDYPCVFREVTFEERRVLIPELDQLVASIEPVMADA